VGRGGISPPPLRRSQAESGAVAAVGWQLGGARVSRRTQGELQAERMREVRDESLVNHSFR
jgi:hypothetical protein